MAEIAIDKGTEPAHKTAKLRTTKYLRTICGSSLSQESSDTRSSSKYTELGGGSHIKGSGKGSIKHQHHWFNNNNVGNNSCDNIMIIILLVIMIIAITNRKDNNNKIIIKNGCDYNDNNNDFNNNNGKAFYRT